MTDAYGNAVAALYALGHELAKGTATKFELGQVRRLLTELGEPQQRFPAVLVAGTNGKGSTAATLASILRAAGQRTALFTSPHLVRVNERIQIDGQPISDRDFVRHHERTERAAQRLMAAGELPWHPSFFEMLTAMAFLHFAEQRVGIAVLEVGMGGRLDATNVVEPLVSVITDISMDHEIFLGHSIGEIAGEKAGIIHEGGTVVTLAQLPEANEIIARTAAERGAEVVNAAAYMPPVSPGAPDWRAADASGPRTRYELDVMGETITVDSPLVGRHQVRNLALAIATAVELDARGIRVRPGQIAEGIRQTSWPGRFQVLAADRAHGRPEIVLDVAHNPAGAWALRAALADNYEGHEIILVFGVLADKAVREIVEALFPAAGRVLVARPNNPRAASIAEIRAAGAGISTDIVDEGTVGAAVRRACGMAGRDSVVVVTGSIYTVGEALAALDDAGGWPSW